MISDAVKIRELTRSEWREYKAVRLRALKESPEAFGSTYAASVIRSDQSWIDKVEGISPHFDCPLVAIYEDEFVGLAWAMIKPPELKTAHIYQMWVDPKIRGKGVGKDLMLRAISWAREKETNTILLEVTYGDRPARHLYEALGFTAIGDPLAVRQGSDLLEQAMKLEL